MSRALLPWLSVFLSWRLCNGVSDVDCLGTTLLQHHHEVVPFNMQASATSTFRRSLFRQEAWGEASCSEVPWMCAEPFDCLNSTGKLEPWKEMLHQLAKPSGVNYQAWCYAGSVFYQQARQCATQDLHGYAQTMLQFSQQFHTEEFDASYCFLTGYCQNDRVTLNTTILEAEDICDELFPEPQGWRSVGLEKFPDLPPTKHAWNNADFDDAKQFMLFSCAMGNFHCDINYCHETYCQMESYAAKFQNLAPLP